MVNKGAQAMTLIAVNELCKRYPQHRVYLYSPVDLTNKELDRSVFKFEFTGWYPLKFARCQKNPLLRAFSLLRNRNELLEAEEIYRNTDAIIDISGFALGSDWDAKICSDFLDVIEFAEGFGIPVYLMPQSFGPFDFGEVHGDVDERCRRLLPGVKKILAREREGYEALVSKYGLTNVTLAPDLVLNNKGIELENVYKKPPVPELPEIEKGSIALIPNGRNLSVGNGEQVISLYCEAISHALEKGRRVYLLHHSTGDADICALLKERFSSDGRVVLLEREFSCIEFNELVKSFDYLIASRFHSIVHAFKNGIPCITLGWATKYKELLALFSQEKYLFDVRNFPDGKKLCEAMDIMDLNRDREAQRILSGLSEVQKDNVFDHVDI